MPASKAEQVLEALRAVLETVPGAAVERNSVLPEKIPDGGLVILRDGDPREPEQAIGGFGNASINMPSRSRSTSRRAMRRRVTLPSIPSSSRLGQRSKPIPPSAASPSA
jgi:hypothetical protein